MDLHYVVDKRVLEVVFNGTKERVQEWLTMKQDLGDSTDHYYVQVVSEGTKYTVEEYLAT